MKTVNSQVIENPEKINKIHQLRDALASEFMERSDLIDGMLVAVLSKENLLMLGPPGTAKSLITKRICQSFSGKYFSWLMGKLTTPEEVFGPPSLKGLEQDRYVRNTTGKLPDSDIAFLDEVFKGSSAILNTLLTIMNERIFFNDGKENPINLQTLFGASNELPQGEELAAMYDRFVLRFFVDYIQEDTNAEKLFNGLTVASLPSISLDELKEYQDAVDNLKVPQNIIKNLVSLRRTINEAGLSVSDRKWRQAISVLKAFAWLNGNSEVTDDDLDILNNVLWNAVEQRSTVRKEVAKVCNPLNEKILQHQDAVASLYKQIQDNSIEVAEAFAKMQFARNELRKMAAKNKNNKKLDHALEQVQTTIQKVAQDKLGIDLEALKK